MRLRMNYCEVFVKEILVLEDPPEYWFQRISRRKHKPISAWMRKDAGTNLVSRRDMIIVPDVK